MSLGLVSIWEGGFCEEVMEEAVVKVDNGGDFWNLYLPVQGLT
ncbi:hypothetical protein [Pseudohalioglobus lutimaris]|nr:hypothetical protein [Pseudohalioglobus lutimaris]